jgi:hypothetical protein
MSSDEEDTSLSDMAREFGFTIPTAASRSTVSTSGEFLGSGGGVNVSSPVRGGNMFAPEDAEVPVFIVTSENGENVCGGLIGVEGKRFCTHDIEGFQNNHCGTLSHGTRKAELKKGDAFIHVPKGRSPLFTSAYLFPTVNVTTLSAFLVGQLQEAPRSVVLWTQKFTELSEEIGRYKADFPSPYSSPARKSRTDLSVGSAGSRRGSGGSVLSRSSSEDPSKPNERPARSNLDLEGLSAIASELEGSSSEAPDWNTLVKIVTDLGEAVVSIDSNIDQITNFVESSTANFSSKIAKLISSERILSSLPMDFHHLKSAVATVSSRVLVVEENVEVLDDTSTDRFLAGEAKTSRVLSFVKKMFETSDTQMLMLRIAALERLSLTPQGSVPAMIRDADDTIMLRGQLERMEAEVQHIKASLGGEVVKIGRQTFHSADELESWIIMHDGETGVIEGWIDVVSMLEILTDSGKSTDEMLDKQVTSKRGGFNSISEARLMNSYMLSVPALFSAKKVDFGAVPTYSDFDAGDGDNGLVPMIERAITLWEERQRTLISLCFPDDTKPVAQQLCIQLADKSVNFWRKLTIWIGVFYQRITSGHSLARRGAETLAEIKEHEENVKAHHLGAWKLVVRILTDIFHELAVKRSGGAAAIKETASLTRRSAIVLYATLKAQNYMKELLARGFEKHSSLTPTFNAFLFKETASKMDAQRLDTKMAGVEKRMTLVQKSIDQMSNKLGKNKD